MSTAVIPLESNPEVFTQFAHGLGLAPALAFTDIYSLTEKELLSFVPRPCEAVIMLFPITPGYEQLRLAEDSKTHPLDNVTWFKQTVKNACGLFALLNSISNLPSHNYGPGSKIIRFIEASKDTAKVESLIKEMEKEYTDAAQSGQTEAPAADEDTTLHFISFIKKDGHIYELDGRRSGPFDLGPATTDGDILDDELLTKRFLHYIDLADDENKLNFSLMALTPSYD